MSKIDWKLERDKQKYLKELYEICDSCEAGDPCWCCGINQKIKKLKGE